MRLGGSSNRHFTKGGNPGTKVCIQCGKRTWVSKGNEQLCESCYDYAGWENTHSDNDHASNPCPDCPVCQKERA